MPKIQRNSGTGKVNRRTSDGKLPRGTTGNNNCCCGFASDCIYCTTTPRAVSANISVPLCEGCLSSFAPGGSVRVYREWLDTFFTFADCLPQVGTTEGYQCTYQKVVSATAPGFPRIVTYPVFLGDCSTDAVEVTEHLEIVVTAQRWMSQWSITVELREAVAAERGNFFQPTWAGHEAYAGGQWSPAGTIAYAFAAIDELDCITPVSDFISDSTLGCEGNDSGNPGGSPDITVLLTPGGGFCPDGSL